MRCSDLLWCFTKMCIRDRAYPELMSAAYRMVQFKGKFHKVIDCYADYRLRDQMKIERRLENLAVRAKGYY